MRTLFFVVLFSLSGAVGFGQCDHTMNINVVLETLEEASFSETLAGALTSIDFGVQFTDIDGGSYPSDLMVIIEAPNGNCVVWGGWNEPVPNSANSCDNLGVGGDPGVGGGGLWTNDWDFAGNGFYNTTIELASTSLGGTGTWTITLINAWDVFYGGTAQWDMEVVFNGICEGDCFDPDACNFNPNATLAFNDLCEYASDVYPSGLYDCDGNCLLDFDDDGICNADEVPGCQVEWACNYNPTATDPPLAGEPCTYPDSDVVDCDGTSLLPQFLTQPQNQTVSCNAIPEVPIVAAQPAPASVAYYGLFPESCYDDGADVDITFDENIIGGGACPGNYTIERLWVITDCKGFTNSMSQIIDVVDNLPPLVLTDLDPDTLGCDDNVVFATLQAEDACGGNVLLVGDPSFVTLPGTCPGESVQKKFTTLSDQCGNTTLVEQIAVVVDNAPPYWDPLTLPEPVIVTNDLAGTEFGQPEAGDVCSGVEVSFTQTEAIGACPFAEVITRTYVAVDQCGNMSVPFVQTITEDTLVVASVVDQNNVTCHGGNDGAIAIEFEGGVGPYNAEWLGGYNPEALPAGMYEVTVFDANGCSVTLDSMLITQPGPFGLSLEAFAPECTDDQSGIIDATINGGVGEVTLEWGNVNPNAVAAGTYSIQAIDEAGCLASATAVVPPADIPESYDISGITSLIEGESAAYYYEFTQGSTYEWTLNGATSLQMDNTFAISVVWDSSGTVCVQETNTDGCVGEVVCLDVEVEDDVWSVNEPDGIAFNIFPNPTAHTLNLRVQQGCLGQKLRIHDARGRLLFVSEVTQLSSHVDVQSFPAGLYVIDIQGQTSQTFNVLR